MTLSPAQGERRSNWKRRRHLSSAPHSLPPLPSLSLLLALVPMARTPDSNAAWQPPWLVPEREGKREAERWAAVVASLYTDLTRSWQQKGKKTWGWKWREVGEGEGKFLVNSQKLLACFLAVTGAGQQKLLLFLMRFGNWLPQDLPFSAWFFRSRQQDVVTRSEFLWQGSLYYSLPLIVILST